MTFLSILETIFIGPLKLIFEVIFDVAYRFIGHPGLAIIMLSLIMNILILPLYRRADAMQEEARDTEAKLHKGVQHIRKTFSGDERMMILQTYYRQNNYKPTSSLNGSVSLLLEIPFFIAAYQFLSHLEILQGTSLGPITDMGAPDGLLVIGGITINLLPVLMTLINVISSALYLKGFPLKTKIQLYAMALFFLVFLYQSPACLVFYWTLNNIFSLVKTIFYKIKNPQKVLRILTTILGIAIIGFGGFVYQTESLKRRVFLVGVGVALLLPLVFAIAKKKIHFKLKEQQPNRSMFILGALCLAVLVGALIPSTYISSSPLEFVDVNYFYNPLWYIVSALCLATGTFVIWMGVFYWLADARWKSLFGKLVWIMCGVMLVNYMFFGTKLGVVSSALKYETGLVFTNKERMINILVVCALAVILYVIAVKWKKAVSMVLLTMIIALGGMSVRNAVSVKAAVDEVVSRPEIQDNNMPNFQLSKTGKNVVVLMLDRSIGGLVPYIMNENPELKEQFSGFKYYKNTISFGAFTNFGSPALLGGYEYTPVEMNKRDSEPLVSKQNEALKVMPVTFLNNDYKVTVCDPVYANYQWIPDLSIYDDYPEIQRYITKGKFGNVKNKKALIKNNRRNFFCFSIMKTMPIPLQSAIYNGGEYNQVSKNEGGETQVIEGMSKAKGSNTSFEEAYQVMTHMIDMTKITEDAQNTFLLMTNDMTHEVTLLKEPEYEPSSEIDNTEYDAAHADRFTVDGKTLTVNTDWQMSHYQINMAAFLQLGKWFDYLRENGVYDNTKIILVADHGEFLAAQDELYFGNDDEYYFLHDGESYFPLLMVKDFGSTEFTTSDEFMTNADVPTLAMDGLIQNPVNPFTGKSINSNEKTAHDQFIIMSNIYNVAENGGNTFVPAGWISVKDNIWDKNNWNISDKEDVILKDYVLP